MTVSPATVDFSTLGTKQVDPWSGTEGPKKSHYQERDSANPLFGLLAGAAAASMPVIIDSHSDWVPTVADYSILGGVRIHPSMLSTAPILPRSAAPLSFLAAYHEMASFRALEAGWDGLDSDAISEECVDNALAFLALLPSDISMPEASASSDGTVDWHWRNEQYAATVTFFKNGQLAYYAQGDDGVAKDSYKFNGSIPDELVQYLRQL